MLTEMQKEWFRNLIEEEISEEEGTVDNEECWADGSDDHDTMAMHRVNATEHRDYAEFLRRILEEYCG